MAAHLPSCGCLQSRRQSGHHVRLLVPQLHQLHIQDQKGVDHSRRLPCNPNGGAPSRGDMQVMHASRRRGSLPKEARLPDGYVDYETMLLLRPDLTEEERDIELAKFQGFLEHQKAKDITAMVRGVTSLAYPIKGFWEGVYVLYTYTARRSTSVAVQTLLAKPPVGEEKRVLRFATFCM